MVLLGEAGVRYEAKDVGGTMGVWHRSRQAPTRRAQTGL